MNSFYKYTRFLLLIMLALMLHTTAVAHTEELGSKYPIEIINSQQGGGLVLMFSGDGGSNTANKAMATSISQTGNTVLLLNSNRYFWNQKTPEQLAKDVEEIVWYYMRRMNKVKFSIVGYSFGADVAAFLPRRLSAAIKEKLQLTILLSPSASTDFVIRVADMLSITAKKRKYSVLDEIKQTPDKLICVVGKEDEVSQQLKAMNARLLVLSGGHNFDNKFTLLAAELKKIM